MPRPNWVVSALLVSVAVIGGAEARPRPWTDGKEFPTETAVPAPDTVNLEELKPTQFNIAQDVVDWRLRKRQQFPLTVCGFIGGRADVPAICSSGSICIWDTEHTVVGCSPTNGGRLAVHTSCTELDGGDDDDDDNDPPSPWVFTCANGEQCYQNSYDAIDGSTYYQYGCGDEDLATTVRLQPDGVTNRRVTPFLTQIDMTDPPVQSTTSSEPSTSSESSSSSSSTSSDETSTTDNPSPTGDPSETTPPPTNTGSETSGGTDPTQTGGDGETPPPSGGSSTPTGAIAGGVVGGIAGIALIAGAFFFLRRRKQQKNMRRVSEVSGSDNGPHDMGAVYEQKPPPAELDTTPPPSELPGDTLLAGPSKNQEPVELPGSEVPVDHKAVKEG